MLLWLAASDSQPRGSTFVDWVPLIAALLVFVGVFISAYVARVNARKPWYENLATLVKVHNDWPDGVHGKETIEQAIADMLAGIRIDTGRAGQVGATEAELAAEEKARRHYGNPQGSMFAVLSVWSAVFVLVAILLLGDGASPHGPASILYGAIAVGVVVMVATYLLYMWKKPRTPRHGRNARTRD